MPKIDGKKFPYTEKGKAAAKKAGTIMKKKRQITSDGYMPARKK